MKKRGQSVFGMPFSVIFSIIIIIAILVTAFFVIRWFLDFQRCTQAGLFLRDLDDAVKEAYDAPFSDKTFSRPLPSSVEKVCVADPDMEGDNEDEREMLVHFRRYADRDSNVFIYPSENICYDARSRKIDYVEMPAGIYCFQVNDGKAEIQIKRDYTGKVKLEKK
jgi:hypothetical protein